MKNKETERKLAKLAALEAGGVDNWEGYDFALKDWWKENKHEENCQEVFSDICAILCDGCYEPSERGAGFAFDEKSMEIAFEFLKNKVKEFNP